MQKQTKMDDLIHYGNQSERVRISTRAMTFNEANMNEASSLDQETDLDSNEQVEKIELPHPNNVKPSLSPSKSIDQNIVQKQLGQDQQQKQITIKIEKKVVKLVDSEDSNKKAAATPLQLQQQISTPNKQQHKQRSQTQKAKVEFNPIVEEELQNEQSATIGVNVLVQEIENQLKIKETEEKKDNKNNQQSMENSNSLQKNEKADIIKQKIMQSANDFMSNHSYKHLIFSPNCSENQFKRHLLLTYRGLVYAKKCLKGPSMKFIKSKQVTLATSKSAKLKKTLFFDLDETLIHSCQLKENPQVEIKAQTDVGQETILGINIRPYCMEILERLSDYFDIFIFTASSPTYATAIIKHLDPQTKYIQGILSRVNCMETKNGFFIKDLRIIKNRELKDMVIVDNLAHSFGFQIDNGIPIMEWHDNTKDTELKFICEYLIKLSKYDDLREFNAQQLKLNALADLTAEELQI